MILAWTERHLHGHRDLDEHDATWGAVTFRVHAPWHDGTRSGTARVAAAHTHVEIRVGRDVQEVKRSLVAHVEALVGACVEPWANAVRECPGEGR